MKDRVSALMDGELDDRSAAATIRALGAEGEALEAWRTYHLIGDAMRDTRILSDGFTARVGERLAGEPAVLAPGRLPAERRQWFAMSAAASVAAVGLVGWLAFAPQRGTESAQSPLAGPPSAIVADAKQPPRVPLPSATNDYLLAHQGYSPRVSFQGMAPYVRTVSEHAPEARK